MPFVTELHYEEVGNAEGRPRVRLTQPLVYRLRNYQSCFDLTVPVGFETDFDTTPRFVWSIFPAWGRWNRPACLHDYLDKHASCSQLLKDALYREAMIDEGVPRWQRVCKYLGLRLFAIATWKT